MLGIGGFDPEGKETTREVQVSSATGMSSSRTHGRKQAQLDYGQIRAPTSCQVSP